MQMFKDITPPKQKERSLSVRKAFEKNQLDISIIQEDDRTRDHSSCSSARAKREIGMINEILEDSSFKTDPTKNFRSNSVRLMN